MKKIIIILLTIFLSGCTISNPLNTKPQITIQEPTNRNIKIDLIKSNQIIESPLIITGQARGGWFFEASFPIKLVDSQGELVAQTIASTKGEWMTDDFVPFSATLEFASLEKTNQGTLIFIKDNPSDMRELDDQLSISVLY